MIPRYQDPVLAEHFSEAKKLERWMQVEKAWVDALHAYDYIEKDTHEHMTNQPTPSLVDVSQQELTTKHDVAAFVDVISREATSDEAARTWHLGLTSSNIVDTAESLMLAPVTWIFANRLADIYAALKAMALSAGGTMTVGRTHGQAAAMTTLGLRAAHWAMEIDRRGRDWEAMQHQLYKGKFAGPVGTYMFSPDLEMHACEVLGLTPDIGASQIISRDRLAHYLNLIAVTGGTLERIATQIRLLSHDGVDEVVESHSDGQKGSSSMPHKHNPVRSERICGLARVLRGYAMVGMENQALWGERDITHSSAERIVLPDASMVLGFMLSEMNNLMHSLAINPHRIRDNVVNNSMELYTAQTYVDLLRGGLSRQEAYERSREFPDGAMVELVVPEYTEYILDQLP